MAKVATALMQYYGGEVESKMKSLLGSDICGWIDQISVGKTWASTEWERAKLPAGSKLLDIHKKPGPVYAWIIAARALNAATLLSHVDFIASAATAKVASLVFNELTAKTGLIKASDASYDKSAAYLPAWWNYDSYGKIELDSESERGAGHIASVEAISVRTRIGKIAVRASDYAAVAAAFNEAPTCLAMEKVAEALAEKNVFMTGMSAGLYLVAADAYDKIRDDSDDLIEASFQMEMLIVTLRRD